MGSEVVPTTSSRSAQVDGAVVGERRRDVLGPLPLIAAGVLLVMSVLGPWTSSGVGSALSGRQLADLFLADTLAAWVPRWVGVAFYVQPVCGGLLLVAAGWGGSMGRRLATGTVVVAGASALLVALALSWGPFLRPGSGALMVGAGLSLAITTLLPRARDLQI
jgi:hypothetical protein